MTAQVLFSAAGFYGVSVCGDVFISYWRRAGTAAARAHTLELQAGLGRRLNVLTVIEASAIAPASDRERSDSLAALKRSSPIVHATAWVVLGEGFKLALARSVIAGWNLVTRPPGPTKVFSTVAEGVAWLARQQGGGAGESELLSAVEATRAALG
jgi:hypothetical protein